MAELSQQQAANLELARTLLDAFQRGDLEASRAFIDPDSEVTSDPVGINTGVYRGYDDYMTWLGLWLEAWDEFTIDVQGMEPVGERHVVVDVLQRGRGRSSGVPVDQHLGQMWDIVGGKDRRVPPLSESGGGDQCRGGTRAHLALCPVRVGGQAQAGRMGTADNG